jgi:hypothetical protein
MLILPQPLMHIVDETIKANTLEPCRTPVTRPPRKYARIVLRSRPRCRAIAEIGVIAGGGWAAVQRLRATGHSEASDAERRAASKRSVLRSASAIGRESVPINAASTEVKSPLCSVRARHGFTREATWIQQTPAGDLAIVLLESDDLAKSLFGVATSEDPFDAWFRSHVLAVHGIDLAAGMNLPEQVLDYVA